MCREGMATQIGVMPIMLYHPDRGVVLNSKNADEICVHYDDYIQIGMINSAAGWHTRHQIGDGDRKAPRNVGSNCGRDRITVNSPGICYGVVYKRDVPFY